MQAPTRSGYFFFNYKKTLSIILMDICNPRYQFTNVDVDDSRRQSDGSVYVNSNLGYVTENKELKLPGEKKLKNSQNVYHMYL